MENEMVNITVKFEDQFSGAKSERTCTRTRVTFEKMKADIGLTFPHFDKQAQIRSELKVISVEETK